LHAPIQAGVTRDPPRRPLPCARDRLSNTRHPQNNIRRPFQGQRRRLSNARVHHSGACGGLTCPGDGLSAGRHPVKYWRQGFSSWRHLLSSTHGGHFATGDGHFDWRHRI